MQMDETTPDISVLSEGHIDVLRGVDELKNSKEIARDLGISPHTVDQRLKRVQNLLGVNSRFEAARLYREYQDSLNQQPYQSLVYQSPVLSNAATENQFGASPGEPNPAGDGGEFAANDVQAPYFAGTSKANLSLPSLSVLWENDRQNTMSFLQRTAAIGGFMAVSIVVFVLLLSAAEMISKYY